MFSNDILRTEAVQKIVESENIKSCDLEERNVIATCISSVSN